MLSGHEFEAQDKKFVRVKDEYFIVEGGERKFILDPLSIVFVRAADVSGFSKPVITEWNRIGCTLTTVFGDKHVVKGHPTDLADVVKEQMGENPGELLSFHLVHPPVKYEDALKLGASAI